MATCKDHLGAHSMKRLGLGRMTGRFCWVLMTRLADALFWLLLADLTVAPVDHEMSNDEVAKICESADAKLIVHHEDGANLVQVANCCDILHGMLSKPTARRSASS